MVNDVRKYEEREKRERLAMGWPEEGDKKDRKKMDL